MKIINGYDMEERKRFLDDFKLIADRLADRIAVYQVLNLAKTSAISFFELNRVSSELSDYLSKVFVTIPHHVGVWLTEYTFLPLIILAIWKSGGSFAGVGTQHTTQHTLDYLNFLKIKYLITDKEENIYNGEIVSRFCIHNQKFGIWRRQSESNQERSSGIWDVCYGLTTSGSTGVSKIIQVPWSCILPNVRELVCEFQIYESDCVFQASPCTFDPFFVEFLLPLITGCSLLIVPDSIKLCPSSLLKVLFQCDSKPEQETCDHLCSSDNHFHVNLKYVQRKTITLLQMTPTIFKRWKDKEIRDVILSPNSSLRVLILGGEKFPNDILNLKSFNNKTRIFNIYGITEISCWAFLNEVTKDSSNSEVSLGRALKDITYKISEELILGSKTRVCLVDNETPFCYDDEPVFRNTGDVVDLVDGHLYFVSRTNDLIKKYGVKVSLNKIEKLFVNDNKLISECCCVYDELYSKLGLFYVVRGETAKSVQNDFVLTNEKDFLLKGFSKPKNKLGDMEHPDYLIQSRAFPLNPHGKCDKKKLLRILREIHGSAVKRKPGEDLRKTFAEICTNVLGIDETISQCRSFKDLGGNSVSALQIINKLQDSGLEVPVDFIGKLLSDGSLETCLQILISGGKRKKVKVRGTSFQALDDGLSVRWRFDLGKCVDATPTIVTFEGTTRIIVGSHSHKLCSLNAETGTEIWTISLGDRIESGFTATKDGRRGFVGCYDHCLYSVLVSDGSILWKYETGDMVKSTPCLSVDEKIVYVASYDQFLHCVSTLDGKMVKRIKISEGAGIFASGLIGRLTNALYIGTLDGTCLSVKLDSNEVSWRTKVRSPIFATPCLLSNESKIIFVEVLGVLHCLSALTGDRVWTFEAGGNIYSSPVVQTIHDSTRIVFGCHDDHLYCLQDGESCELKWKRQLDSPVFARPCIFGMGSHDRTAVCAATTKGFIYLCDLVFGSVSDRIQLTGEVFSSPVVSRKSLFIGCRDNYLYSLDIGRQAEVDDDGCRGGVGRGSKPRNESGLENFEKIVSRTFKQSGF